MENSELYRLNSKDLWKGLVVAVLVVVLGALENALTEHGLSVMEYDWAGIMNMTFTAVVAYLGKNLFSTTDGKVLGKIG